MTTTDDLLQDLGFSRGWSSMSREPSALARSSPAGWPPQGCEQVLRTPGGRSELARRGRATRPFFEFPPRSHKAPTFAGGMGTK